jgi:hypothetical protein
LNIFFGAGAATPSSSTLMAGEASTFGAGVLPALGADADVSAAPLGATGAAGAAGAALFSI